MSFVLTYDYLKYQKLRFKKVTSSPLPGYCAIAQQKKDIGSKLSTLVVGI